jgi:hypothetical protein
MRRLRPALLLLAALALGMGSVATWGYAHRGYQSVVYHWHATLRSPLAKDSGSFDEWIDPSHHWSRATSSGPSGAATWLFRDGMAYSLDRPDVAPSSLPESPGQLRIDQLLRQSGFAGFNQYWLADADAPVVRTTLDGRAALRFTIPASTAGQADLTVWLDARTHDLLQRRWVGLDGVPETLTYTVHARLGPGALPADFFTPRRRYASPLDQALAWIEDHLGRRP